MKKIWIIIICFLCFCPGSYYASAVMNDSSLNKLDLAAVHKKFHSSVDQRYRMQSYKMLENFLYTLYVSDKADDAKAELEILFDEKIDDIIVFSIGVEILGEREQKSEIIRLCNSFLEKNPESVEALQILKQIYIDKGDNQSAQKQISRILELAPDDFTANIDMGQILYSENKFLLAVQYFSKAQNIDPNEIVSYIGLGKIYFEQNEFIAAIEQLEKGRTINQHDPELLGWLGLAYRKAAQDIKAVETLRAALELDPANDLIRLELAKIYIDQLKYSKASEQLEMVSDAEALEYEKNVMLAFCYGALAQISKMRLIMAANPRVFAIMMGTVVLLCLVSLGLIGALFITAFLIGKKTRKSGKYKNINWSLQQAFFICIILFTLPLCLEILLGGIVYNNWILFLSPARDIQTSAGQNALLSQLVTVVFTGAAVFWFALKRNGQSLRDLGFRWIKIKKFAMLSLKSILMIFLFNIIYMGVFSALSGVQPEQQYIAELISNSGRSWSLVFLFFFAVIAGPFAEEVIFRGFIYSGLRKHCSFMTAAVISACIFGIFHLQESLFIPLAFMGFILARMFERTRSILPAIVVHMLWNFLSFINLIFLS